jgi:hypothetical protein
MPRLLALSYIEVGSSRESPTRADRPERERLAAYAWAWLDEYAEETDDEIIAPVFGAVETRPPSEANGAH